MGVASDITRRQSHSKLPDPLTLNDLSAPLSQCFLSLRCWGCFVVVSTGTGLYILISSDQHLLQRDVSLMSSEDYTYLWIEEQVFRV